MSIFVCVCVFFFLFFFQNCHYIIELGIFSQMTSFNKSRARSRNKMVQILFSLHFSPFFFLFFFFSTSFSFLVAFTTCMVIQLHNISGTLNRNESECVSWPLGLKVRSREKKIFLQELYSFVRTIEWCPSLGRMSLGRFAPQIQPSASVCHILMWVLDYCKHMLTLK